MESTAPTLRIGQYGDRLQFEQGGQNVIQCPAIGSTRKDCLEMENFETRLPLEVFPLMARVEKSYSI